MEIPKEFFALGEGFHQDTIEGEFQEKNWVEQGVRGLKDHERDVLRVFLGEVLRKDLSDLELEELWAKSGSDFFIYGPNSIRNFFRMVHDSL
jgi:hypothetical protein